MNKIKAFYMSVVLLNQSKQKRQPELYLEKCGQFQNPNNSRTKCEIAKKFVEKSAKMKNGSSGVCARCIEKSSALKNELFNFSTRLLFLQIV